MIRKTIAHTKAATYCIELPDPNQQGMPAARGTGFFVSGDGWFVTAAHVITQNGQPNGPIRDDIDKAWLMKESPPGELGKGMCQFVSFDFVEPSTDFALLKVDFAANANKVQLIGLTEFPYLQVSSRILDEGEPVYSFGYPLSETQVLVNGPTQQMSHTAHSPRTTSAIVAATMNTSELVSWPGFPAVYVLDKALNYGNSGGPIVATETGKVHALCSRFQPVFIPQNHYQTRMGFMPYVMIPSLYAVVSRLNNQAVLDALSARGVSISDS